MEIAMGNKRCQDKSIPLKAVDHRPRKRIRANNRAVVFHSLSLNSPAQSSGFEFPLSSLTQSNIFTRCVRAV